VYITLYYPRASTFNGVRVIDVAHAVQQRVSNSRRLLQRLVTSLLPLEQTLRHAQESQVAKQQSSNTHLLLQWRASRWACHMKNPEYLTQIIAYNL
jgi:hypothetical protein